MAFEDEYLHTEVGTVVRINKCTLPVDAGDTWRVGFVLLRHVLDI